MGKVKNCNHFVELWVEKANDCFPDRLANSGGLCYDFFVAHGPNAGTGEYFT